MQAHLPCIHLREEIPAQGGNSSSEHDDQDSEQDSVQPAREAPRRACPDSPRGSLESPLESR